MIAVLKPEEMSTRSPKIAGWTMPVAQDENVSGRHIDQSRVDTDAGLLSAANSDPSENPDLGQTNYTPRTAIRDSNKSFLTTILITDVVNSTEMAAELGDAKWREIVNRHDAAAMRSVHRHDGTLHKLLGDGFISTFQRPSDAIACAQAFQAEAKGFSLSVRAGIHSGECLRSANDITGIAIAIAARVLKHAPGECVWVSSTVRELLLGSGLSFVTVGSRKLRGVPNEWTLYEVAEQGAVVSNQANIQQAANTGL